MATEAEVAQAYMADTTSEKERTKGMGRLGAAHGAGFIIGPAIGGFLSIYGFSATGFAAALMTGVNFLFAFFFLPESNAHTNSKIQKSEESNSYWCRLRGALMKPLIGTVFVILFLVTYAFSAVPVIVPLLGIEFGIPPHGHQLGSADRVGPIGIFNVHRVAHRRQLAFAIQFAIT